MISHDHIKINDTEINNIRIDHLNFLKVESVNKLDSLHINILVNSLNVYNVKFLNANYNELAYESVDVFEER